MTPKQQPPPRASNQLRPAVEENTARGPHTPVPEAITQPPPAMPMPPPKELAGPRKPQQSRPGVSSTELLLERYEAANARAEELAAELERLRAQPAPTPVAQPQDTEPPPTREAWLKAGYKFLVTATLLLSLIATYLGARAATKEQQVEKVAAQVSVQQQVTAPLPEKVQTNERATDGCKVWARDFDDYFRQVARAQGVVIPQQPNALPVKAIETRAPRHKPNAVTGAPVLEVLTPPPSLP